MVAMPAIARAGLGPIEPAAAKQSGTTTATPSPINPKPAIATAGTGATTTRSAPVAAIAPLTRTVATEPNRCTTRSPTSRPPVIASAKPVNAAAARPGSAPVTVRR